MTGHPEMNEGPIGDLVSKIGSMETVEVWCNGCQEFTVMNAAYAKYLQGEIDSCSKCRK